MRTSFILIVLGFAFLAGCKSSTSPGTSTAITPPNAGSYFIIQNMTTDSTGAVTLDTTWEFVLATNVTIYGKSGVTELLDSNSSYGWAPDTNYLKYEANGDVSTYQASQANSFIPNEWTTVPFGSQTSSTIFSFDTSLVPFSRTQIAESVSGDGDGNVTIQGQTFSVEKVNLTVSVNDTVTFPTPSVTTSHSVITVSFAPSLGNVVETDQPASRSGGYLSPATHSKVVAYVLR